MTQQDLKKVLKAAQTELARASKLTDPEERLFTLDALQENLSSAAGVDVRTLSKGYYGGWNVAKCVGLVAVSFVAAAFFTGMALIAPALPLAIVAGSIAAAGVLHGGLWGLEGLWRGLKHAPLLFGKGTARADLEYDTGLSGKELTAALKVAKVYFDAKRDRKDLWNGLSEEKRAELGDRLKHKEKAVFQVKAYTDSSGRDWVKQYKQYYVEKYGQPELDKVLTWDSRASQAFNANAAVAEGVTIPAALVAARKVAPSAAMTAKP